MSSIQSAPRAHPAGPPPAGDRETVAPQRLVETKVRESGGEGGAADRPRSRRSPHRDPLGVEAAASRLILLVMAPEVQAGWRIESALRLTGYTVRVAASAGAALDLLAGGLRPDLLLADAHAPGVADPSFVPAVRSRHSCGAIVVLGNATDARDEARLLDRFQRIALRG